MYALIPQTETVGQLTLHGMVLLSRHGHEYCLLEYHMHVFVWEFWDEILLRGEECETP